MTSLRRSQYELGDPVLEELARDERSDHYRAYARGHRTLLLADAIVSVLHARGLVTDSAAARREIFHVVADRWYGRQALDVPDFMNEESLAAMRRGRSA